MTNSLFQPFKSSISGITLPEKFTFPFYYDPHPLSVLAANELQLHLQTQQDFTHNFGLDQEQSGWVSGKMFGVLVCQNQQGELGYLWAFSGKLADVNHLPHFVPTVFDMLEETSFFKKEKNIIDSINQEILVLENEEAYLLEKQKMAAFLEEAQADIQKQKKVIKEQKKQRSILRIQSEGVLSAEEFEQLNNRLKEESQQEGILLKKINTHWNYRIEDTKMALATFENRINALKELRKEKSITLQQQLFDQYSFLNQYGERKSVGKIFDNNPPAGAGECAAPKLLHYAFQEQLKPICMAEFWWGQSPKSEIRKHKQFYAACKSKCEPILLGHMLQGIEMDDNPLLINPAKELEISTLYEDDVLLVINKPAELLSAPGKAINDSVYQRMKERYPDATGPLIVHRLDMPTSGIMLIAKTERAYLNLQKQFIKRTVKKCYEALLDGVLAELSGFIDLPLRGDFEDRPRQLVCYEHGKKAHTKWEVISIENGKTRVNFYPITGRTHQLRVHASHPLGLNTPIMGDDLYGTKANRLHLHAKTITFNHPVSREELYFEIAPEF
ncbi:MAG: pseudouridine synthase [Flectobacillus sp.]|nr:pseudouridine synthase [Flectobacillus sp.]